MTADTHVMAEGNFLIPNGTFFVELLIFLIVLTVIWVFVVPPIRRVLSEREQRVATTAVQNKQATEIYQQATARHEAQLDAGRAEVAQIRSDARAEGRAIVESLRADAQEEADRIVAESAVQLRADADQVAAQLRENIEPMAAALAQRVIRGSHGHAGSTAGQRTERAAR